MAYRRLRAPVFGLHDAPAAFRETANGFLLQGQESLALAGLKFRVPTFDPTLFFVFRGEGGALGALTTHSDVARGCEERDAFRLSRKFPGRRFGDLEVQEQNFARFGMELTPADDFSVPTKQ